MTLMIIGRWEQGFVVDIFYDSIGIHTASCVFLAFEEDTNNETNGTNRWI